MYLFRHPHTGNFSVWPADASRPHEGSFGRRNSMGLLPSAVHDGDGTRISFLPHAADAGFFPSGRCDAGTLFYFHFGAALPFYGSALHIRFRLPRGCRSGISRSRTLSWAARPGNGTARYMGPVGPPQPNPYHLMKTVPSSIAPVGDGCAPLSPAR